ncbi:MAG: DUF4974 domain-containing protein [Muribaculaceae bacterium]|nr:DUF4974 domain-containing protein [Muribaculaceae bacterium]
MDNYSIVLELIEHPKRFSPEQINELLSDPENKEIYSLLCKTNTAMQSEDNISDETIEAEWQHIEQKHFKSRRAFSRIDSRAAAVAAIIFTSLAAAAIGIAVTFSTVNKKQDHVVINDTAECIDRTIAVNDTTLTREDDITAAVAPVIFENAQLDDILKAISEHYGVIVRYNKLENNTLRLYYKFDSRRSLDEIIDQLNTFEQINISLTDSTLIVE